MMLTRWARLLYVVVGAVVDYPMVASMTLARALATLRAQDYYQLGTYVLPYF